MPSGSLVLLAGPNGAGKTTAARSPGIGSLLRGFLRLNADDLTLKKLKLDGYAGFADAPPDLLKRYFIQAAEEVYAIAREALLNGVNVSLETVLSTDKYCALVEAVLADGGHSVPADRLEERWKRSLKWLPWFAAKADFFYLFDNSDSNPELPPLLLARLDHLEHTLRWQVGQDAVFSELKTALSGGFPREVWPHSHPS